MHRLAGCDRETTSLPKKTGEACLSANAPPEPTVPKKELSRRRLFPLLGSVLLPRRRLLLLLARRRLLLALRLRRWLLLLALCLGGTLLLMFLLLAVLHAVVVLS